MLKAGAPSIPAMVEISSSAKASWTRLQHRDIQCVSHPLAPPRMKQILHSLLANFLGHPWLLAHGVFGRWSERSYPSGDLQCLFAWLSVKGNFGAACFFGNTHAPPAARSGAHERSCISALSRADVKWLTNNDARAFEDLGRARRQLVLSGLYSQFQLPNLGVWPPGSH